MVALRKKWLAARDEVNALKLRAENYVVQDFVQHKFIPATNAYVQATQELVDGEAADVMAAQAEVKSMFNQLYQLGMVLIGLTLHWRPSSAGACRAVLPLA